MTPKEEEKLLHDTRYEFLVLAKRLKSLELTTELNSAFAAISLARWYLDEDRWHRKMLAQRTVDNPLSDVA